MPDIDPFGFDPAGPFNPLISYWHCTISRLIYWDEHDLLNRALVLAGGHLSVRERFEEAPGQLGIIAPRVDIYHLPGGDMVHIRGTNTYQELFQEIAGAGTIPLAPWAGRVSTYFGAAAVETWLRISGSVSAPWIATGHSLGGAIAGLISQFGAEKVWTLAQPREGNRDYADSRDNSTKLRLFNVEDLGPKVPAASGVSFDGWTGLFPGYVPPSILNNYWHWGVSVLMQSTGIFHNWSQDRGMLIDLGGLLLPGTGAFDFTYWHSPELYSFRIRRQFPYQFPAAKTASTLPGLAELDEIHDTLNRGVLAESRGAPVVWNINPPFASRDAGPNDPADAADDWHEVGDESEGSVYPFRCPGD